MMNGWDARILGQQFVQNPQPQMGNSGMRFDNPIQRFNFIRQAMTNPAAFVRQYLNGIPEQALQDPTGNSVLQYMINNMGVTQNDIQNAYNQASTFL